MELNLKKGVTAWAPNVNAKCASAKTSGVDLWHCLMGHYVAPYLTTQLFVFQWQFDKAQLYHDAITNDPSDDPTELAYAQQSAANLTATFRAAKGHHHFFSPSCYQHVVLNNKQHEWVSLAVGETTLPDALDRFVRGAENITLFLDTCETPDCNPTCPPPQI